MKALPKSVAAMAILSACVVVLSPLVAALSGIVSQGAATFTEFRGISGPLSGSAGSALVSAMVALFLGTPFALLVERSRTRPRRVFWTLGLLVLMMPPYVVAEAAIDLLGPAGKITRPAALLLGFGPRSTDPIATARYTAPGFVYSWPAVGAVMGGCLFPIVALAVASAYRRTDHRVFEAARLARGMRGVCKIGAFVLIPPACGAALLVFALTLTEFAAPQLLRVRTIGEAIYERIQEGDLSSAAALSLTPLPVIVAAGGLGAFILMRDRVASLAGLEGEVPRYAGRRLGRAGHLLAGVMTLLAITPALILPIVSLVWLAATAKISQTGRGGTRKSSFLDSLRGAWELAHDDAIRTILLAGTTAALATLLAIGLVRLASRVRWGPALGVLGAGAAIPAPIVGLGLIILWNRGIGVALYQSSAIVLLAWFARFFPFAVFMTQAALARVPQELEDAAALAGRGPIGRFLAAVIPNAAPGLIAAWLAIYVLSASEYGATVLVAPPGRPLLAPSVVTLMRRGHDPELAAYQVLLLGVIASPLVLIALATAITTALRSRIGVVKIEKGSS